MVVRRVAAERDHVVAAPIGAAENRGERHGPERGLDAEVDDGDVRARSNAQEGGEADELRDAEVARGRPARSRPEEQDADGAGHSSSPGLLGMTRGTAMERQGCGTTTGVRHGWGTGSGGRGGRPASRGGGGRERQGIGCVRPASGV